MCLPGAAGPDAAALPANMLAVAMALIASARIADRSDVIAREAGPTVDQNAAGNAASRATTAPAGEIGKGERTTGLAQLARSRS